MHNASLQNIEARLSPEGAGRSPERPMSALMFVPQPTAELVIDIFVDQPEVPSSVKPGEVRAPAPQDRLDPRNLLAERDPRFPFGVSHITMDKSSKIQGEIERAILTVAQAR